MAAPASRWMPAYLAVIIGAGSIAAGVSAWQAVRAPHPPALHLVAAVLLVATGDVPLLRIRYGGHGHSFTWAEASLVAGAALVGWPWLIAAGAAAVLGRQLVVGRGLVKAAWNAGNFAAGGVLGELAYRAVAGSAAVPAKPGWREGAALVVAAAVVYYVWISTTVAGVVALAQGVPFRRVWRKGSVLRTVTFLGNTAAGLGLVLAGADFSRTSVAFIFFLTTLYLSYNSFLRAQQERDAWHDLQRASLDLNRVSPEEVSQAAGRGAAALFGADRTVLLAHGGSDAPALRQIASGLGAVPSVLEPGTTSREVAEELAANAVTGAILAPLNGPDGRLGALLLGFDGPVQTGRRELRLFATYANQVAGALARAQLFTEMSEQRSRLARIVDSASDGIALLGPEGNVRAWNPAMAGLTGVPERSALGRPVESALIATTADGSPVSAGWLLDAEGGEVVLLAADGRQRHLELSVSAVAASAVRARGVVLVGRDVTAQRELEAAKQDFVATVSHELRTPLTPIKGWLSILLRPDYAPPQEQLREIYGQLLGQARSLERLVEDLLSVSRIDRGHFDIRLEAYDAREVVAQAVRDAGHGSDRPLRLQPGPPAPALIDPSRLRQVIANLLSNADKYSPAALPVDVLVAEAGDRVRIEIRDHGPGVPPAMRGEVFEPFRRLGSPLTRTTRGTGLGLHIARSLVVAMSGEITVSETHGGGATFTVELPAAPAVGPNTPPGRSAVLAT